MFDSWSMTYIWHVTYDIIWHITYDILVSNYRMWETMTYGMRDMRCEILYMMHWTMNFDKRSNYDLRSMIQDLWYVACNMIPELPKLRCEDRRYISLGKSWWFVSTTSSWSHLGGFFQLMGNCVHGDSCQWFLGMRPRGKRNQRSLVMLLDFFWTNRDSQFKFHVGILQLEILNSSTVSCSIVQCFFLLSFSLAWQSVKSMWRV